MVEAIDEPIEIITLFRNGKVVPMRFRWRNRVIRIRRVAGDWSSNSGRDRVHYFSVIGESTDCFEIAYDMSKMSWTLARVWLDG
jgi:hypothetical protein